MGKCINVTSLCSSNHNSSHAASSQTYKRQDGLQISRPFRGIFILHSRPRQSMYGPRTSASIDHQIQGVNFICKDSRKDYFYFHPRGLGDRARSLKQSTNSRTTAQGQCGQSLNCSPYGRTKKRVIYVTADN